MKFLNLKTGNKVPNKSRKRITTITSIMFLDIIHRLVRFLKNTNKKWTRRWIMSKNIILEIIYHRHKRLNLNNNYFWQINQRHRNQSGLL
jgi:hypothetical protein